MPLHSCCSRNGKETPCGRCTMQKNKIWTQCVSDELYCSPLGKIPCVALTLFSVLSSFSLSPQLSSMTGHKGTASKSWSISLQHSSLLCYLFSCPPTLSSWLPYLAICALVCALRLFVHIRTETNPDFYLPVCCRIHNERKPKNDIHSLGFFPSMSLWLKCKCTYKFHIISVSCPPEKENL